MSFLEHALRYAARGWPVFPLAPRGKLPLISKDDGGHGFHDATTDIEQIRRWWERVPNANIGLATTVFDVLDIDGEEGKASIRVALAEHDEKRLPPGPRSQTGSGGLHVLFRTQGGGNRAGMLPKVDWRGTGRGYIVAPPSVHPSGGVYEWIVNHGPDEELPDPPEWLRRLVVRDVKAKEVGEVRPLPANIGDGTAYGVRAMEGELAELARQREGNRNHGVNACAFSLFQLVAGGELSAHAVENRILQVGMGIGLDERETRQAMGNGKKDGLQLPRNAPPWLSNGKAKLNGSTAEGGDGTRRAGSQASQLVAMAEERYEFGRAGTGEAYAVPKEGAYVARMLRGGADSLRAELAAGFVARHGKVPSSSALADAMAALEGRSQQAEPVTLALRVARPAVDQVVLDLGDLTGRVVAVSGEGWEVLDRSPVLFRRSKLTGTLPVPSRGGTLEDLRALLHVTEGAWPLVVAWLVAALLEDIPHPILMPTGEQGSGKTTFARMLVQLIDPSPAPVRSTPKDDEAWAVAAAGSHVVALDNISKVAEWLSDALCRAVTGDGLVRRQLYTDSDLTVLAIRRVVVLTSIDPGALRGDLADRLLPVELERLDPAERLEDAVLAYTFAEARPAILGALLDTLVDVLDMLPAVQLDTLPRMADFARVAAAVDTTQGLASLPAYLALGKRLAAEVVEGDYVGAAIKGFMAEQLVPWSGTASELLDVLRPEHPPKGFPADGSRLSGRLKRVAPALRSIGIHVDWGRTGKAGTRGITLWTQATGRPGGEALW